MSQNSSTPVQNEEIDLGVLYKKIKDVFKSLLIGLVMLVSFFWKKKIPLLILLSIGIALQIFMYLRTPKVYSNEFLLRTNFESTEYLYGKVKAINAKFEGKDTIYLKNIFGKNYERVKEIEITPVIDMYYLINDTKENKEILEILLDKYDDLSFLEEQNNINQYPYHKLKIYTSGSEDNKELSDKFYQYLLNNSFYKDFKKIALQSYQDQLAQNEIIRNQIDSIVANHNKNNNNLKLESNALSINANEDFNSLLRLKREVLYTDLELKNMLHVYNDFIKIVDASYNLYDSERTKYFFVIPALFILIYCLFFFFIFLKNKINSFINE